MKASKHSDTAKGYWGSEKGNKNELRRRITVHRYSERWSGFFLQNGGRCLGARGHCLVAAHFAREEVDPWYSGQSSLGQCCPGLNRSWKGFRSTEGTVQNWLLNTIQKHVRPTLKLTWYLSPLSDMFFFISIEINRVFFIQSARWDR